MNPENFWAVFFLSLLLIFCVMVLPLALAFFFWAIGHAWLIFIEAIVIVIFIGAFSDHLMGR